MDNITLKSCPFCGGKARVSFKWNGPEVHRNEPPAGTIDELGIEEWMNGHTLITFYNYRCQVICNHCHARGKPVFCNMVKGAAPYHDGANELYEPYIESAIEAWNRRVEDGCTD